MYLYTPSEFFFFISTTIAITCTLYMFLQCLFNKIRKITFVHQSNFIHLIIFAMYSLMLHILSILLLICILFMFE